MKKFMVLAATGVVAAGLAIGLTDTHSDVVSAATQAKKYSVAVKYVGDDKKVLKTVKKSVARNASLSVGKLTAKEGHNYAYVSGAKKYKITKSQTITVKYKRSAYDVTIKYVGDDKKVLKTVKKNLKRNSSYKIAQLSKSDKAIHNYAYKSGAKAIKVTKDQTATVTYKRVAYDVKFVLYKSDVTKPFKTTTVSVPKGGKYLYYLPAAPKYYSANGLVAREVGNVKSDWTLNIKYYREFKFVVNFNDFYEHEANRITNQSYDKPQGIGSKTITVLDGQKLSFVIPNKNGNLSGWELSKTTLDNDDKNFVLSNGSPLIWQADIPAGLNGLQITTNSVGQQVLTSAKIDAKSWQYWRWNSPSSHVEINLHYKAVDSYWTTQFQTKLNSVIDAKFKNIATTSAFVAAKNNLKNSLFQAMIYNDNGLTEKNIDLDNGQWNKVIKGWADSGVTVTALAKPSKLAGSTSFVYYGDANVGLDYENSFYQAPDYKDLLGSSPELNDLTAYFIVNQSGQSYYLAQDQYGNSVLVKKALLPGSGSGFWLK